MSPSPRSASFFNNTSVIVIDNDYYHNQAILHRNKLLPDDIRLKMCLPFPALSFPFRFEASKNVGVEGGGGKNDDSDTIIDHSEGGESCMGGMNEKECMLVTKTLVLKYFNKNNK